MAASGVISHGLFQFSHRSTEDELLTLAQGKESLLYLLFDLTILQT